MSGNKAVVGVFSYLDDVANVIEMAKEKGLDYRGYSPFPHHILEEVATPERSPVRIISLIGAVSGLIFGFTIAIMMSLDWPMRTSAKDIVSIPGFVVIGYECTILFGAIFTLMAMFHFSKIPDILRKVGYDPRFSQDKFGIVISCNANQIDEISQQLQSAGAEEVEVRDGL